MDLLDRRLNAYRNDLADFRLKDQVGSLRFVEPKNGHIDESVTNIYREPHDGSSVDTQLIYGEPIRIFDHQNDFAWIQSDIAGYVGYIKSESFKLGELSPTHRVTARFTFCYQLADLKSPMIRQISMGSLLCVVGAESTRGTKYLELSDGRYVVAQHISRLENCNTDYVTYAEKLVGTAYLWGGKSAFGIDCSGLVQLAKMATGCEVLRDTDMQENTIGQMFQPDANFKGLQRGDLVFWPGHVAIMCDATMIIHANGHTMDVVREPLYEAIERISYLYGVPRTYRRPS